ncbi:MAG: hypothetical protein ACYCPT_11760 [Acidimicrobiales bacterium]
MTDEQVAIAGYVIDLFSGRPYSMSWTDPSSQEVTTYNWWENVGAADAYYMKLAVCYQTVWMTQQPDLMTRLDVKKVPTTREPLPLEANALSVGPLAKKALSRVSWLRSRALHVRSPFEDLYTANSVNFGEWIFPWSPIGGGFGFPSGPDY